MVRMVELLPAKKRGQNINIEGNQKSESENFQRSGYDTNKINKFSGNSTKLYFEKTVIKGDYQN